MIETWAVAMVAMMSGGWVPVWVMGVHTTAKCSGEGSGYKPEGEWVMRSPQGTRSAMNADPQSGSNSAPGPGFSPQSPGEDLFNL